MRLYLVQHGEARSEAEDPERSLTIGGEEETRKTPAPQKGWAFVLAGSITAGRRGPSKPLGSLVCQEVLEKVANGLDDL